MKKVLALCLALALVLSLGVSAFAAKGAFIQSPSNNQSPVVVGFNGGNGCTSKPIVTGYGDRGSLSPEDLAKIEEAYNEIANANNPGNLVSGLGEGNFAISDLFDLSFSDCGQNHDGHGNFDITLKPETLNNFHALIRKTQNGWEIVKNATANGNHLLFTADSDAVYAIVVGTKTSSPQTGDSTNVVLYVTFMVVCAAGFVFSCKKFAK